MTTIIIINLLAIVLIPGLFFWIIKNIPSLHSKIGICILLLCAIHLYKTYGFSENLIFANITLAMVLVPAILDLLFTVFSSNKLIKLKKIGAIYEDQIVLKILPLKFKIMEMLEFYAMILGIIFASSAFMLSWFITTNSMKNSMELAFNELLNTPAAIDSSTSNHWYLIGVAILGVILSVILYFVIKNVKKKMLPVFWRAQLLPVFNPESELYEKITEITDTQYLRQIFEVNDFILIETDVDRVEQHNKNLGYIMQNYPLTILKIQQKVYLKGTSIGVAEVSGKFHFYFLKLKRIDQSPPPAGNNKEQKTEDKASVTEGVPNAV